MRSVSSCVLLTCVYFITDYCIAFYGLITGRFYDTILNLEPEKKKTSFFIGYVSHAEHENYW